MKFGKDQHKQIVEQLQARGDRELAVQYNDWIFSCEHFNGDDREEAALERQESVFLLYAKERGITPR